MEPYSIGVYDRKNKKKRKITFRVASNKRDRRKTEVSTFVNFIHQKDAYIAMRVVEKMIDSGAPIYTVHDNFISNALNSYILPSFYLEAIKDMGEPLFIINEFFILNIILATRVDKYKKIGGREINDFRKGYKDVFTKNEILIAINSNIPEHVLNDKKKLETWNTKRDNLADCYQKYSQRVSGGKNTWEGHTLMWNK